MPASVNMSVPGFDRSRTAPLSSARHGFRSPTWRLAGWPPFDTTPQPALSAVFGIRELVCPGSQGLSAGRGKQLTVQPGERLGPPIIGGQSTQVKSFAYKFENK